MPAAVVDVSLMVLRLIELVVFGAVIASWVGADPNNVIVRALRSISEPLLARIRPLTRRLPGPIDWSPAVLLLGIQVVKGLLLSSVG